MKRGAERQLTREAAEDDEVQEVTEDQASRGMPKAEESVLATRKIRALPRRSAMVAPPAVPITTSSASATPEPEPEPPSVPKFGGFGGFGTSSSITNPFSFTAPKPAVSAAAPASASSAFSSSPFGTFSAAPSAFPSSNAAKPSLAPPPASPSNATKLFTSVVNSATSSPSLSSLSPSQPATKPQNGSVASSGNGSQAEPEDARVKAETKYYSALRGLNTSFLAAITKAVDSDPFTDLAEVLERYKSFRASVKTEYDDNIKKAVSPTTPSTVVPKATEAPKLPVPPSAFSFGGSTMKLSNAASTPAPAASEPSVAGMPKPPTAFSSFGFNFAKPPEEPSSGAFAPQSTSSPSASKTFSFGDKPASAPDVPAFSNGAKSAFGLPAGSSSSFNFGDSSAKAASSSASASNPFGAAPGPSIFSSNLFGGATDDTKGEKAEKTQEPKDSRSPTPGSQFGGPAFGAVASAFDKPASASTSSFAFGSSSPTRPSFTFGKSSSGSIGNPVGFGFGSPPKTPDADTSSLPPKTGGFSFGAPPKATESAEDSGEGSEAPTSAQATPGPEDPPPMLVTGSIHDQDGEGEEDEETAYEQRCKVYRMAKKDDGTQEWKDMGVGMLKLKVHKESEARRVLLRNSSTGKIIINFNVHSGMNPSVAKNVVSFMGHDSGASLPYKIRVKTNDQANDLKKAIDTQVEKVQAKS